MSGSLISFGFTIPGKALKNALSGSGVKSIKKLRLYVNFFNMASQLSIAGGVVGTLVGIFNMLATMDNPSTIGASMAVALLTVFYGVLLSELVFQPLKHALITQSVDVCEDSTGMDSGPRTNNRWIVLGLGVFTSIVPFMIMIVSFFEV
ncbi:MotA/TolQ/ExbB proton channel family protein [Candidatus Omnitrophota bacterium]